MIAAKHRVSRRLSPALRLKLVRRAELRELEGEGEEGEREAAAYGASVTEGRSVKVSATRRCTAAALSGTGAQAGRRA